LIPIPNPQNFNSHPNIPNFRQQNSTITFLNMGDYREFGNGLGNQTPSIYKNQNAINDYRQTAEFFQLKFP
jgi:hypothetical protein